MLFLHQSNRLEQLLLLLCKTLAKVPADPLATDIVVVQNPGMARWVFQQIALHDGIAANLDFPLPATFIWRILDLSLGELPDISSFSREVLTWRIMRGLAELAEEPLFEEIQRYLGNDPEQSRRLQLAQTVSDLFDQYLVYRPDKLLQWEKETPRHWQMRLWQWLARNEEPHRARLMELFFSRCDQEELDRKHLPHRVCLFGINSLAPVYIEILARISSYIDIHLFHLSPCRQAWDDIVSAKTLFRRKKQLLDAGPGDTCDYYSVGNPLLASLGRIGRDFFQLLLQQEFHETEQYEDPGQDTLLGGLQADILDIEDRSAHPATLAAGEDSIHFHICHSPMREVQVLHNQLLRLFEDEPDLKPGDILVMAPDISRYAPAIAGVFGAADDTMRIPWSVADRSRAEEDQLVRGFLDLLALPGGRFTTVGVLALLENPAIAARFAIRPADLPQLRGHIVRAGIRWGLDREQCRADGLPDLDLHTWLHGLDRLLLGHCLGSGDASWQGLLPSAGQAGSSPEWLGGLAMFLHALRSFVRASAKPQPPSRWHGLLLGLLADFFLDADGADDSAAYSFSDSLVQVRQAVNDFLLHTDKAGFREPLSLAEIRSHLEGCFADAGGHAFLSGQVTFCNMVPMRSLPFQVVYLLGMNDSDYPRSMRPADFDLIARQPRPGDRNRRDDDRYLFLEALLSARRHFIISWVGRDQQENTQRPPSTVVAELRDYINQGWKSGAEPASRAADALTTEHPLQPFSPRCFSDTPDTANYGALWLPAAEKRPLPPFFIHPLTPEPAARIRLDSLVRFWGDPLSFLLEERLGLRLRPDGLALPESEPFGLDGLGAYLLRAELLQRLRRHVPPAPACARAAADGLLPGFAGQKILCAGLIEEAESLCRRFEESSRQETASALPVECDLAGTCLTGRLDSLYSAGRIVMRPARHKGRDLLSLYIHHLLLCLLEPAGVQPVSTHIATDATLVLAPVPEPATHLEQLLDLYREGLCRPLHFYPDVSHALAKAKTCAQGLAAARRKWYSGFKDGIEEKPGYRLALRGREPLDDEFVELAQLFVPLLSSLEVHRASP